MSSFNARKPKAATADTVIISTIRPGVGDSPRSVASHRSLRARVGLELFREATTPQQWGSGLAGSTTARGAPPAFSSEPTRKRLTMPPHLLRYIRLLCQEFAIAANVGARDVWIDALQKSLRRDGAVLETPDTIAPTGAED